MLQTDIPWSVALCHRNFRQERAAPTELPEGKNYCAGLLEIGWIYRSTYGGHGNVTILESALQGILMNSEVQPQIRAAFDEISVDWTTSIAHGADEGRFVRWFKVISLTSTSSNLFCLGLSDRGFWVAAHHRAAVELESGQHYLFFLAVMEFPLSTVKEELKKALMDKGLPPFWMDSFPFDELMAFGLESSSEYWTGLALQWAGQASRSDRIQDALQTCMKSGPSQKMRHAAKRLVYGNSYHEPT